MAILPCNTHVIILDPTVPRNVYKHAFNQSKTAQRGPLPDCEDSYGLLSSSNSQSSHGMEYSMKACCPDDDACSASWSMDMGNSSSVSRMNGGWRGQMVGGKDERWVVRVIGGWQGQMVGGKDDRWVVRMIGGWQGQMVGGKDDRWVVRMVSGW